ncbi:hypothetical protein ACQPZF_20080 [Actinosynnema sp. CS-041913]|uniref:hypothetical protein n=1 Tax=Actinosynnema sp. CS-041913 TaxID=3239917 RepID=UPI003D8B154B
MSGLAEALGASATPVIAEVKVHGGDGAGLLRGRTPAEVVAAYQEAGAAALSVVTGRWFGGTPDLLGEVVSRTSLPVLRKDFVVGAAQLRRTRDLGASAVLLTARLLAVDTLRTLVGQALDLGLTPFVEVVDEAEVAALGPVAADCVVAVNNKDITVRETDAGGPDRGLRLLPAVLDSGTRCAVSASGIDDPADAARLLRAGYSGLLVATALLAADHPADWFGELRRHLTTDPSARLELRRHPTTDPSARLADARQRTAADHPENP